MLLQEDSDADDDGLDEEEQQDAVPPNVPFDPMKIRVVTKAMPVVTLCNRLEHQEIVLDADYQRERGIWSDVAQSQFIESLLLRLPVPACHFAELPDDKFEVIDGVQRMTALYRFRVEPDPTERLVLQGLEYLKDLDGKRWEELGSLQRRLDEVEILVFLVSAGTPEGVKLNIFKRLNRQGLPLAPQEIRHALNPGPIRGFLEERARSVEFQMATGGQWKPKRMADREMVARFVAFDLLGVDGYPGHADFDTFLDAGMKRFNGLTAHEREDLTRRFADSMRRAKRLLDDWAFRWPAKGRKKSPLNRALYDATAHALARLEPGRERQLERDRVSLVESYKALFEDSELLDSIKVATTHERKVRFRFGKLREFFSAFKA